LTLRTTDSFRDVGFTPVFRKRQTPLEAEIHAAQAEVAPIKQRFAVPLAGMQGFHVLIGIAMDMRSPAPRNARLRDPEASSAPGGGESSNNSGGIAGLGL